MPTTISLIRHGLVHNPQAIYYGRLPRYRLSETGRAQATAAGQHLQQAGLSAIYHSPLLRARQTAALVQQALGEPRPPLSRTSLLLEVHTPYDGITQAEMATRNWDLYTGAPAPYEQPADVVERLQRFLWQVRQRHAGEHIAAVTHGDVVAFTWLALHNLPLDPQRKEAHLRHLALSDPYPDTASITTLCYETADPHERPQMRYTNPHTG